ncbi:hypothetical protein [Proteiniclasticum sp. QWL-01]|uniref:hypothetical protein n=1 Tax=Proteiniclasticum sp. QWL-01 TaxID=3036945 RepID=UPI00240F85C6|nr:hypothetical protein [Proteiniclasticum sp. QWL-01]WFF72661.1 hypothetical protein P6M73_15535 [Proteiniclasticum sp. QWL-01]
MAYEINPVEHGKILAEVGRLKDDIKAMEKRIDELEAYARRNDTEHQGFSNSLEKLQGVPDSLKKIENSILVVTPKQAKENGNGWLTILLKNPTYLMWIILGAVIISMVLMGYNFVEISQVLEKLK